ncbi:MAG: cobalamin biosynthesis protein, partial [Synergistaceae bacterium]|nr:cobalamin biosynthesis protein [Synergistaceae bacterium]
MKTAFFCFSSKGEATARRLEEAGTVVRVESGALAATVASWWSRADALVFVASLGIAVRAVAPHLSDKADDPAVLVVTEDGKTVLPVTGAHLGGGRELAERLAGMLGVEPLLTTSSDRAGLVAPDLLASRWGWALLGRDALAATNGALIETGALSFWTDVPELLPPLPAGYAATEEANAALLISPRAHSTAKKRVQLVPPCIVAGMGCRRGASAKTLRSVLNEALRAQALLPEAIREIRTVEEKMDEPGL